MPKCVFSGDNHRQIYRAEGRRRGLWQSEAYRFPLSAAQAPPDSAGEGDPVGIPTGG